MKKDKLLPIGFAVAVLTVSGAAVVTAQSNPVANEAEPAIAVEDTPAIILRTDGRHGDRRRDGGRMPFGALFTDSDGDGTITPEEIALARAALIAGADASQNGEISLEEYETIFLDLMRDPLVDSFQHLDADGNGAITDAEFEAATSKMLERMDRDDDDHHHKGHKDRT